MKFNKLYLHGFKSFVDKTVVDFPDGITAIVGPNGSGKSNIMDAVRWVFGEQNAKELRGAEMDDVVFNGSQKRKGAGFAEVGLTLSEIDESVAAKYGTFSEITVTRKFYKTGEREYYINNRKCRLKDIKDIFMDTGLGARSISIIEQGKVDKVVNATPEELRFFLEEAAGVTRFKDKKKSAEKRLAQTRDNLDRVNDIIAEILIRRDSLASQVEVLKESSALQKRKRDIDKKILCHSFSQKTDDSRELSDKLNEFQKDLDSKIAQYTQYLNQEREADNLYAEKQSENTLLQEKRLSAAKDVTKTEGAISALKERLAGAETAKEQLAKDIENARSELLTAKENAEKISDDLESFEDMISGVNDKIDNLRDIIDDIISAKENAEDDLAAEEAQYLEYTSLITNKRNSLIRKEAEFEHSKVSSERLESEAASLNQAISIGQERQKELEEQIKDCSESYDLAKIKVDEAKSEVDKSKVAFDECKIKGFSLEAAIDGIKKSLSFLENELDSSRDDFGDEADLIKSFNPSLLIDKLHEFPKNFLGEIGDVILFGDDVKEQVIRAVSSMRTSLKFTFESMLPVIKQQLSESSVEETEFGLYFSSGIYRKVGDNEKGLKIVRLKERIEEERLKLTSAENDLAQWKDQWEILETEFNEKNNILSLAVKNASEIGSDLTSLKSRSESLQSEIERNSKRLSTVNKEISLALLTSAENEKAILSLKEEMKLLADKQSEVEERRTVIQDKLDFITDDLDDKKDEMRELKIFLSSKESDMSAAKRELAANSKLQQEILSRMGSLQQRLDNLINIDETSWRNELSAFEELLVEGKKMLLSLEESLENSFKDLNEIKINTENIKKDVERSNEGIKVLQEQVKEKELAIASTVSFLEAISQQYFEKFATDIKSDYEEWTESGFQPRKAKEEIGLIEKRLEELGPINLNAENDYNETEERYTFLSGQRKDLEESVNDIVSFITQTDEATARMFETTFNSVKEKFIEVFHILFGAGEADLRLTEPDNLLISGVEIYIQPPGKKLQHMGLLSGGEKALAAMTLLFGLFLHKPTPFCFLDEVDAPLDDANVDRYISMVKALSGRTQFILITHNHNTMAIADSLYGVTMQEYGVSKILSVKLEQVAKAGR